MRSTSFFVTMAACLCLASAQVKGVSTPKANVPIEQSVALNFLNQARGAITPPCDYRITVGTKSPCNGQRQNKLPRLTWAADLAQASRDYALLCPTSLNPNLAAGLGQTLFVSFTTPDTRTKVELLRDAILKWSTPIGYDAATGTATGAAGRTYKQVIASNNREVGCAVHEQCERGRRVVCTFRSTPATGIAYPVLNNDLLLQNQFRDAIVTWANRARLVVFPRPRTPLAPLQWDAALAASAQSWANKQTLRPSTYDPTYTNGESKWASDTIWANPGFSVIARWFALGIQYNLEANTCRDWRGNTVLCGKYTQLVGANVRKIGCGIAWNNGHTFVICRFDQSYSNKGVHTIRPYEK